MTSVGLKSAALLLCLAPATDAFAQPVPVPAQSRPAAVHPVAVRPVAPAALSARIRELGAGFNGRVGIAVQSVDEGWRAGWKADELYPQQSVSKFWVALTAMDAVDRGR